MRDLRGILEETIDRIKSEVFKATAAAHEHASSGHTAAHEPAAPHEEPAAAEPSAAPVEPTGPADGADTPPAQ